jgi:hypothetical protein
VIRIPTPAPSTFFASSTPLDLCQTAMLPASMTSIQWKRPKKRLGALIDATGWENSGYPEPTLPTPSLLRMSMLARLSAAGALARATRRLSSAATDPFITSAERALVYSNLHRNAAGANELGDAARSLALMDANSAPSASTATNRRQILGSIASYLHQLGEEDVARVRLSPHPCTWHGREEQEMGTSDTRASARLPAGLRARGIRAGATATPTTLSRRPNPRGRAERSA